MWYYIRIFTWLALWLCSVVGTIVCIFAWKLFPGANPLYAAIAGTFFARGIGNMPTTLFDRKKKLPRYNKYMLAPTWKLWLDADSRSLRLGEKYVQKTPIAHM